MTEPTPEEIQKVREHECMVDGHHYDVAVVDSMNEPVTLICTNCGRFWEVEGKDPIYKETEPPPPVPPESIESIAPSIGRYLAHYSKICRCGHARVQHIEGKGGCMECGCSGFNESDRSFWESFAAGFIGASVIFMAVILFL